MKAVRNKWISQWGWFMLPVILFVFVFINDAPDNAEHMNNHPLEPALLHEPVDFEQQVKPVLEQRCVVCHGCYDAPCQLKLSSIEGLQRGASRERIYEPKRITTMQPTRLFIDSKSTEEWRQRGFSAIINEGEESPVNNLQNSVMYHLLRLKRQHPLTAQVSDDITLGLNREENCPTLADIDTFSEKHPQWGMPYAMPDLSDQEYQTLVSWLAQGAQASPLAGSSAEVIPQILAWENFLNQSGKKQALVSRYLYEHLFHAHIHFDGSPDREFYRLVRSYSAPGDAVEEISSLRPYDDPQVASFYYRLIAYTPSIVAKSHIVYQFSDERMQRYRELFLQPDYTVSELPSYNEKIAANPFKVFSAIPADSRYRFLLDDAHFFIEGFVKGPVCRGQIALDVIEDQFWVLFFDPKQSIITNNTAFLDEVAGELRVPSDVSGNLELFRIWTEYWKGQRHYMEKKQAWFNTIGTHDLTQAMNFIWDGDGVNPNAALTVFRHFDSGSVAYGLIGDMPETAWVIDYPLFERIHYLLVAGFDVYGSLGHRMSARIYMDFLRMEGEDYFLAFLPVNHRKKIRDGWYQGQRESIDKLFKSPQAWLNTEAVVGYQSNDPQAEFYQLIQQRLTPVLSHAAGMNRCGSVDCSEADSDFWRKRADRAMQNISNLQGQSLDAFPDVAFVRVRTEQPKKDFSYTLIRNKAYKNVTSFLADELERNRADIEKDTMTVVEWQEGSYPNFFFSIALSELDDFVAHCATINHREDYEKLVDQYGVRRTDPAFWELADWFQDAARENKPIVSGLFDLSRYQMLP